MSNFAITGISGYIGQLLLKRLASYDDCKKIIGIDIKNPVSTSTKLKFYNVDIRDDNIGHIFEREKVDTLVHLAFIFQPIHDMKKAYDIDVNGAANILKNAAKYGVKRILLFSSTTAYGAHEDNPGILTEESPLRGNRDFYYTYDKAEVEKISGKFISKYKDIIFINIRPCIIFGPNANNHVSRYIDKAIVPFVLGYDPDFQLVHEADLIDACMMAFEKNIAGSFNIVGKDTVKIKSIPALGKRRLLEVPFPLFYFMNELMWKMRVPLVEMPASMSSLIMHRWVASGEKARKELGFVPKYSTKEAVLDFYSARMTKE